ncbi:hypothetical protein GCM10009844_15010 [Nocardioides koreensis]|uniref:Polysaccharide chain length determinant N-terminal domain-containing protein n=1 Tax=Nocardioides koreensis TaxID=433651 RepID=A0ABP5LB13_9ACTN
MIDTSWRIEDPDPDEAEGNGPATGFVSLHFLRSALRRRWKVWVAAAITGLLLGLAWNFGMPAKGHGTVTLLMSHDPATEQTVAMDTDVSLLRTRTVAESVIEDLGLPMTPEELQASITATDLTPSVLVIDVAAPDDASAVARVTALAEAYLSFRADQLESQSQALVAGYEKQMASLKDQSEKLSTQYEALSATGPEGQSRATDALSRRSQVNAEYGRIQQLVEEAELQSNAIIESSHVLDPPSAVPRSAVKRLVLTAGSGLIGGLAIGMGLVLFQALTSDRVRRREEVALALGTPVRYSARKVRGGKAWWRRGARRESRERGLQVLVRGLEPAVSAPRGKTARLALVAVDEIEEAALVTATLGAHLAGLGKKVFLVDLSDSGRLDAAVKKALARQETGEGGRDEPVVFRPEGQPSLARGPVGTAPGMRHALPKDHPRRAAWNRADVVLVLAEVDPAVGVDHLPSWVDRVVLLVAAGRSNAERLRTTGELVRSAGLEPDFAMLVGADRTDESLGRPDPAGSGWTEAEKGSR